MGGRLIIRLTGLEAGKATQLGFNFDPTHGGALHEEKRTDRTGRTQTRWVSQESQLGLDLAPKQEQRTKTRWGQGDDGPRVMSLFTGVAGLDHGIRKAIPNTRIIGHAEIDPHASAVLRRHFPDVPNYGDVRNVRDMAEAGDLEDHHILIGGFPCTDLSIANRTGRGLEGPRSGLYREMLRVAAATRPPYIVAENVPRLASVGLDVIARDMHKLGGYSVTWDHVPASAVGAPHIRDRIFIIAHPPAVDVKFTPPERSNHWTDHEAAPNARHDGSRGEVVGQVKAAGNAVVPQVAEHIGKIIHEAGPRGDAPPEGSVYATMDESGAWVTPEGKPVIKMPRAGRMEAGVIYKHTPKAPKPRTAQHNADTLSAGDLVWVRNPEGAGSYGSMYSSQQREMIAALADGQPAPNDPETLQELIDFNLVEVTDGQPALTGWGQMAYQNMPQSSWAGEGGANELIVGRVYDVLGDVVDVELPGGEIEPMDPEMLRMFPTPAATDWKGGRRDTGDTGNYDLGRAKRDKGGQLRHWIDGAINPRFSEWLMGFPPGWLRAEEAGKALDGWPQRRRAEDVIFEGPTVDLDDPASVRNRLEYVKHRIQQLAITGGKAEQLSLFGGDPSHGGKLRQETRTDRRGRTQRRWVAAAGDQLSLNVPAEPATTTEPSAPPLVQIGEPRQRIGQRARGVLEGLGNHPPPAPPGDVPDLASYDVILVNSSAGKDSQAALDHTYKLAKAAGVEDRIIVVHADLGRVEWEGTRELAEEQAAHYGLRFEVVQRDGDLLEQVWQRHHTLQQRATDASTMRESGIETWAQLESADREFIANVIGEADPNLSDQVQPAPGVRARKLIQKARAEVKKGKAGEAIDFGVAIPWPSSQSRYCTSDQKTSQVKKLITRLQRDAGGGDMRILNVLGIRAQESSNRAKKPPMSRDAASTKTRHVDRWLPIHHWGEDDVWRTIRDSGVRHHPAYDKGMSRLSCVFCVFASRRDLQIARDNNPRLFEEYVDLERRVGHNFRADLALAELADAEHSETEEGAKGASGRRLKGAPGLYLDPIKHRWVRTYRPQGHFKPAHGMQPQDFEHHWGSADRSSLPAPAGSEPDHGDAAALHEHEVRNAVSIGHQVSPQLRRKYRIPARRTGKHNPDERIGDRNWWKDYGFRANPGWDGKWRHTEGERGDPDRYNQEGVERASRHMLRLREMRRDGQIPDGLLDTIALFAITSKRTNAKTHERVFPAVVEWLKKPDSERDMSALTEAMRPLGVQNSRTEDYERSRKIFDTLKEGMQRFPDHGPSLRDWMRSQPSMRGLANGKLSFMLEVAGYEDVACVDARVIQAMTGADASVCNRLAGRLANDPHLYRKFEDALSKGPSYKSSDPAELRLGMAQWRLWDAEGGSDTDHAALWRGIAQVTGMHEFSEGLKTLSPRHGVTADHLRIIAAGLTASYEQEAGPTVYDTIPVMGTVADRLAGTLHGGDER